MVLPLRSAYYSFKDVKRTYILIILLVSFSLLDYEIVARLLRCFKNNIVKESFANNLNVRDHRFSSVIHAYFNNALTPGAANGRGGLADPVHFVPCNYIFP